MQIYKQMRTPQTNIIYKELSYEIVGILYKVHDELGRYALEKQYGDLLERYLKDRKIQYVREKKITKTGEDVNRADFVIDDKIIVELKAKPVIGTTDYYQVKRYLEFANLKLGILVNFRQKYLSPKRVLNSKADIRFAVFASSSQGSH